MPTDIRFDRRRWLQGAAFGAAGAAFLAPAEAQPPDGPDASCRQHPLLTGKDCPQIILFSRNAAPEPRPTLTLTAVQPCPCACEGVNGPPTVVRATYKSSRIRLVRSGPCDQPAGPVEGELDLILEGVFALRIAPCPESNRPVLVGGNCADFKLFRSNVSFSGRLCGTEGFHPVPRPEAMTNPAERCCQPGLGLGSLCGEGGEGLAKGWLLKATYRSRLPELNPEQICSRQPIEVPIELAVDGVAIGPCRQG